MDGKFTNRIMGCICLTTHKLSHLTWSQTLSLSCKLTNQHLSRSSHTISDQKGVAPIPRPRGELPVFGTLFSLLRAGGPGQLHRYIDLRHEQLGPVFQERLGPIDSVFVGDAELIRQVFANEGKYPRHVLPDSWRLYSDMKENRRGLYFMDGPEWLKFRKTLNRILLKDDFKTNAEKTDFLEQHLNTWLHDSERHGEVMQLEEHLYVLSITFMMFFILGRPFIKDRDAFLPRIKLLAVVVREIFECSVQLSIIPAGFAKTCNLDLWNRFVRVVDESVKMSSDLLDDMHAYSDHDGMLHDMLEASIPLEMIRRIVVDFIIAAGDTTATLTQWALYLLGKHENVQERLYSELTNYRGDTLLKNVLKETSRLYPVAPFITRYLPCPIKLAVPGGLTYLVEAEQLISMSMYTCGRNERYYPAADTFEPDRWLRLRDSETVAGGPRYAAVNNVYASLPFAMGSRSCIGRKLAESQLLSIIKTIVLLCHLRCTNTVDIKLNLISVPSEPVRLRLQKRQ